MLKVLVHGINGKMGKQVALLVMENKQMHLLGGFDRHLGKNLPYQVFADFNQIFEIPDVIIDFSVPEAISPLLDFAVIKKVPLVIATTGFSKEQQEKIIAASSTIPIFQSANMSWEVNLLAKIVSELASRLNGYDIEIVETHHNRKIDSPSGTALMLADKINDACKRKIYL